MLHFTIKENSFIARIAARKLRTTNMAIVFGKCIHLYGASKAEFLSNEKWLRHELKHIEQYKRLGFVQFIFMYFWQTLRVGYYKCGLECEAREAENDEIITGKYLLKDARNS